MDSMDREESSAVSLVDLFSNTLILRQTAPYLAVPSVLSLSATCKSLRSTLQNSPETFRYLNLSSVKAAIIDDSSPLDSGGISWRAERMDESLTEEDFFSGPLRGIFSRLQRQQLLLNVKTLILDGLSVPAELVREITAEERFNIKILSIRQAKNLNQRRLQHVLHYLVRPSATTPPKLKALYLFGLKDVPGMPTRMAPAIPSTRPVSTGVMSSEGAQIGAQWNMRSEAALSASLGQAVDEWYTTAGKVMRAPSPDWADTLLACQNVIAFDSVLCRGPRHDPTKTKVDKLLRPAIANIALGSRGCDTCGSCPEGPAIFGRDPDTFFPLLAPPPLHASTVRSAQTPTMHGARSPPPLILRCEDCLRNRWCEKCNKWWCEDCYEEPVSRARLPTNLIEDVPQQTVTWLADASTASAHGRNGSAVKGVHRDCFGCGRTCAECKAKCIRRCRQCENEYCLDDNEGSSATTCDWCNHSGRRTRELY